jgi:gas vesicle protein
MSLRFILGFVIGLSIGISVALALAPQPGAATRQQLLERMRAGHGEGAA